MKELKEKVAVITGAASGIGRAMAFCFAEQSVKLVLADIQEAVLKKTVADLKEDGADVIGVDTDVSNLKDVERLSGKALKKYGAVHILCNNAGVELSGPAGWEYSPADWQWIIGVNLMGVIHGVHTFLPIMIDQDAEGHVVNTASFMGMIIGGFQAVYTATKHAVVGYSEVIYNELMLYAPKIKVSVLCPSYVNTNIIFSERSRPTKYKSKGSYVKPHPLMEKIYDISKKCLTNRGINPGDVAKMVIDAIRDEVFYIITHPHLEYIIEKRFQKIHNREAPRVIVIPELKEELEQNNPN